MLLERLGDAVAITKLPGQGQPLAYRLKPEGEGIPETGNPTLTASLHQRAGSPSGTEKGLGHTPLHQKQTLHHKKDTPHEVKELYRRFKVGELKGTRLELPGRSYPDLERVLETYFNRNKLSDGECADLVEIALAVVATPEVVAN